MNRSRRLIFEVLNIYIYWVSQKKVSIKTFIRSCSLLHFRVFEFIWIQYICKFCLVYHLKDLGASRQSYSILSETYMFFLAFKFSRKTAIKFQKYIYIYIYIGYWQAELWTFEPFGFNAKKEFNSGRRRQFLC